MQRVQPAPTRAVDQRGAGEAELVAQREQAVGQRVRRSVAVDVERRQRDEAAREDAVEVAVLIVAVPGDREPAASVGGDGRVALNAGDVGVDRKFGAEPAVRRQPPREHTCAAALLLAVIRDHEIAVARARRSPVVSGRIGRGRSPGARWPAPLRLTSSAARGPPRSRRRSRSRRWRSRRWAPPPRREGTHSAWCGC